MNDYGTKRLASAIIMQAVRDFFKGNKGERKVILRDLCSSYMDLITDGMSVVVAEKLAKNPKSIRAKLRKYDTEEETV
jgi:hypothetical protein